MDSSRQQTDLTHLGALCITGPDAVRFLQGQLSNDVTRLSADRPLLAGFHNPQGRAIALLRLVWLGPDSILAILPHELVSPVAARLSKFVLRAKVRIVDDSTHAALIDYARLDSNRSRALSIAAGLPQVYAATSEAFVAQMLNLDVLGAIAFDKGCYTGQEIIARAHYRGKVKRRMQRFVTREAAQLAAGDAGMLPDGRSFKVVDAVQREDGRVEFLAVAPLSADGWATDAEAPLAAMQSIACEVLPLPYALPA